MAAVGEAKRSDIGGGYRGPVEWVTMAIASRSPKSYNMRMNKPIKLIPIGNSTGVIFSKELLGELGVAQGDHFFPVRTPDGLELRTSDAGFEADMEIMRDIMRRRRSALRELAK